MRWCQNGENSGQKADLGTGKTLDFVGGFGTQVNAHCPEYGDHVDLRVRRDLGGEPTCGRPDLPISLKRPAIA